MVDLAIVLSALDGGVILGLFVGVGAVAFDRRRLLRTLIARADSEDLRVIEDMIDERRALQEPPDSRQLP
jgi:hypothetical protein